VRRRLHTEAYTAIKQHAPAVITYTPSPV